MLTIVATRKEQLLAAFRDAGLRGLTGSEMQKLVGAFWKLRLKELRADGYVFCEHPSRLHPRQTFRWSLVTEPAADRGVDDVERLLDPPPAPPAPAIRGEV